MYDLYSRKIPTMCPNSDNAALRSSLKYSYTLCEKCTQPELYNMLLSPSGGRAAGDEDERSPLARSSPTQTVELHHPPSPVHEPPRPQPQPRPLPSASPATAVGAPAWSPVADWWPHFSRLGGLALPAPPSVPPTTPPPTTAEGTRLGSQLLGFLEAVRIRMVVNPPEPHAAPPAATAAASGNGGDDDVNLLLPGCDRGDHDRHAAGPHDDGLTTAHVAALCLAAAHLDLFSAIALSCTTSQTAAILSSWLSSLSAAKIRPDECESRLRTVGITTARWPHSLRVLFVAGSRLDVRWLRGGGGGGGSGGGGSGNGGGGSRPVLDLKGVVATARGAPRASFVCAAVACQLARSSASRRVATGACEVNLDARRLDLSSQLTAMGRADAALAVVAGVLTGAALPNLRELLLCQNRLGPAGMRALGWAMRSGALAQLRHLGLADNAIGAAGAKHLFGPPASASAGEVMAARAAVGEERPSAPTSLRSLNLDAGNGCAPLASLTSLNLEGNALGNAGGDAIAYSLLSGGLSSLQELILSRNDLHDVQPLTAAVAAGRHRLRRLLLLRNPLAESARAQIASGLTNGDLTSGGDDAIAGDDADDGHAPSRHAASADVGALTSTTHTLAAAAPRPRPVSTCVRVRSIYATPAHEPRWTPAHRRGYPTRRDAATQCRARDGSAQAVDA